jgi:DNA-binding MarR family transcriptional regulator
VADYSLPTKFDPLIHQQSRLAIMAVLMGCESADFSFLQEATQLTKGTLSKHLQKLHEAGYIEIQKSFKGNYPNTNACLTNSGRKAFQEYRRKLQKFGQELLDDEHRNEELDS